MATQLQLRRGTTSQVAAFTGANGEVVVDTEKKTLFVNDGSTAGGLEIARADFSNISASATLTLATLNATTLNTTNLDLTNLEVTNIKAKDGTSAGSIADSTGVVTIASAVLTTADINAGTFDGVVGGTTPAAGSFTTLSATDLELAGNATFADNSKAIFGTSNDGLEIYHNGSNSFIDDSGTGNLQIRANAQVKIQKYTGENMFVGIADGAASMYHDNVQRIATTSSGATVTGNLSATQAILAEGDHATSVNAMGATAGILLHASSPDVFVTATSSGSNNRNMQLRALNAGSANANQLFLEYTGKVGLGCGTLNTFFNLADPSQAGEQNKLHFAVNGEYDWSIYPYDRVNSHYPSLYLGASQNLKILNTGEVNIGDTLFRAKPSDGMCAINSSSFEGRLKIESDSGSKDLLVLNNTKSGSDLGVIQQFRREGTGTGYIANTSSATSYVESQSDRRAKKNFEDWTEEVLPFFKELKPTKFHFTQEDDSAEKTKGYIAQDLCDNFPKAYPLKNDGEDAGRYFFNPSGMVVYLMKAIQEQQTQIEALQAEVAALKGG